jgi:serine/threonine protein kinase
VCPLIAKMLNESLRGSPQRCKNALISPLMKVFKKGILLRYLQSQWPHGFLQFKAEEVERRRLNLPPPTLHFCDVLCRTMLKDGRFAFLMGKEQEDLRSLIDRTMLSIGKNQRSLIDHIMLSIGKNHGPFSKNEGEQMMFKIAKGMDWLHSHNVVHRDLKASNVLTYKHSITTLTSCYVADYECSVGVVGIGFFRAPEILQVVQNMVVSKRLEVF